MIKPLSQRLENYISSLLIQTLSDMLNKYKQTIDDDEIFLNISYDLLYNNNNTVNDNDNNSINVNNNKNCNHDSDIDTTTYQFIYPNQRHINAVIMCYCEKIVLRNAIKWIKLNTNNLNPLINSSSYDDDDDDDDDDVVDHDRYNNLLMEYHLYINKMMFAIIIIIVGIIVITIYNAIFTNNFSMKSLFIYGI
jgi:hypothetical protein